MNHSVEFILGLLDAHDPATVAWEDFLGPHGPVLRRWQQRGFLATEPAWNPVPSCPHCFEGIPFLLGGRYLCDACLSTVDPRHLQLWRFNLDAFLAWLAEVLQLKGAVRAINKRLWQLGSIDVWDVRYECFFARNGPLSTTAIQRLTAYRNALLLRAGLPGEPIGNFHGPCLSLLELLSLEHHALKAQDLQRLLAGPGAVRFERQSGALFAGDVCLGEVSVGSREHYFLEVLAIHVHQVVAYADIKHHVRTRSGCNDSTEEATFCQNLNSRIKQKWIPTLDALVVTTGKGDGYRLRGHVVGTLEGGAEDDGAAQAVVPDACGAWPRWALQNPIPTVSAGTATALSSLASAPLFMDGGIAPV